jgi:MFS family permease
VFLSAVFTLFVPISAEMSFEFLIFLRFLTGLCESSCFPAVFHFYNAWIPLNEKTFLISYIISGAAYFMMMMMVVVMGMMVIVMMITMMVMGMMVLMIVRMKIMILCCKSIRSHNHHHL